MSLSTAEFGMQWCHRKLILACLFCMFSSVAFIHRQALSVRRQWLLEALSLECSHKSGFCSSSVKRQFLLFSLSKTYCVFFLTFVFRSSQGFLSIAAVLRFHDDLSCYESFLNLLCWTLCRLFQCQNLYYSGLGIIFMLLYVNNNLIFIFPFPFLEIRIVLVKCSERIVLSFPISVSFLFCCLDNNFTFIFYIYSLLIFKLS